MYKYALSMVILASGEKITWRWGDGETEEEEDMRNKAGEQKKFMKTGNLVKKMGESKWRDKKQQQQQ